MILYLDSSAMVKRYVREEWSEQVSEWIAGASAIGTSLITRVETVGAIGRIQRMKLLEPSAADYLRAAFHAHWNDYTRLPVSESVVARADEYAWRFGLPGYDAVHLATASRWAEVMGQDVRLATFDRQLWEAGRAVHLQVLPDPQ